MPSRPALADSFLGWAGPAYINSFLLLNGDMERQYARQYNYRVLHPLRRPRGLRDHLGDGAQLHDSPSARGPAVTLDDNQGGSNAVTG